MSPSAHSAAYPVRVVHALGARVLFVSNAAGGIRRDLTAGTLMMITDHLNLQGRNPLIGAVEPSDTRFPDMSEAYSKRLQGLLEAVAKDGKLKLARGVYAGLLGPTYETPQEVQVRRME